MDNTREKLIELIGSVQYGNGSLIGNNFQKGFIEKIADHLIANGVTFATDNNVGDKWIPVTERLPRHASYGGTSEQVIILTIKDEVTTGWLDSLYSNIWWVVDGDDDHHTEREQGYVTHWMPLPEPPKGD